jgi:hypothetical protein
MLALLGEPLLEYETVSRIVADKVNYVMATSGGEICPVAVTSSKADNNEHSQSLIACVF